MELKGEPYPFSLCLRYAKLVDITRGVLKTSAVVEREGGVHRCQALVDCSNLGRMVIVAIL